MNNNFSQTSENKRIRFTETGGERNGKKREGMGTGKGIPLSLIKKGTKQEKDLEKKFEELKTKIEELENTIKNMEKDGRKYTQKEVFTGRVVFRGEVYNKAGTKVIN